MPNLVGMLKACVIIVLLTTALLCFQLLKERRMFIPINQLNDLVLIHYSSVERVPARCSGSHGFDSFRGLNFFLSQKRVMLIRVHFSQRIVYFK